RRTRLQARPWSSTPARLNLPCCELSLHATTFEVAGTRERVEPTAMGRADTRFVPWTGCAAAPAETWFGGPPGCAAPRLPCDSRAATVVAICGLPPASRSLIQP